MNDPYDTRIAVGDKVAYNFQGEVRLGTVKELINCRRNGKPAFKIKIKMHTPGGHEHISTVSRPANLVVLKKGF